MLFYFTLQKNKEMIRQASKIKIYNLFWILLKLRANQYKLSENIELYQSLSKFIKLYNTQIQLINLLKTNIHFQSITLILPFFPLQSKHLSFFIQIMQSQKQSRFDKFIDSNQINHIYRLNHLSLDLLLRKLKEKIDQEFQTFKLTLLNGLNNLNFLKYIQTYPQDDIKFIFKQSIHASTSEERLNQKTDILKRMAQFQIITSDRVGVADNCLYQLSEYINGLEKITSGNAWNKQKILNWKGICPSGETFIKRYKGTLDNFIPLWKTYGNEVVIDNIFKDASNSFPKQQLKKIGPIFSQVSKTIISAKLLFRASEHNFQSTSFKELCSGHADTLLIAKSHKGNIFGAFTPCKWLNTKEKEFVGDSTASSFLFSLDKAMMFPIKRNQLDYAISAYGGWGPIYGSPYGPDLSISDKCNLNDHSCSSLGSHYQIPSQVKQFSDEAFSLLAGAKKFKVVEYEIYELLVK